MYVYTRAHQLRIHGYKQHMLVLAEQSSVSAKKSSCPPSWLKNTFSLLQVAADDETDMLQLLTAECLLGPVTRADV